jgi:hypothetical protein
LIINLKHDIEQLARESGGMACHQGCQGQRFQSMNMWSMAEIFTVAALGNMEHEQK